MSAPWFAYPFACAGLLIGIDLLLWNGLDSRYLRWKITLRLLLFFLFSIALVDGGLSPLAVIPDDLPSAQHSVAILLAIAWWLFGARTLTVLAVIVLEPRIGGKGHLLQDLLGALIFLMASVAAAAYVLDLPIRGLLVTSGAVAIILGLAIQSTLADVFSGIVLNATKPFRVDDVVRIDGIEGKVIEIDWRSTYLLTGEGSMVVIPSALAAKNHIVNLSRPDHFHSVVVSIELPVRLRPSIVLDSLEKALQGCQELLPKPKGGAFVRKSGLRSVEYEVTGYVESRDRRGAVRNQLYDLIYRQLNASQSVRQSQSQIRPSTRESAALSGVRELRLLNEQILATLETCMRLSTYPVGAVILAEGVVPDALFIVESGVVTVDLKLHDEMRELGRMGPGDLMGEAGMVENAETVVRFTAMTDCAIYRIDRADLEPWLGEDSELTHALSELIRFRALARNRLLQQHKPSELNPGGWGDWFRRNFKARRKA